MSFRSGRIRGGRRQNPFDKYLVGEFALQCEAHFYLQTLWSPRLKFHHSPNEGRRSPFAQYAMKRSGTAKGFPDFVIYDTHYPDSQLTVEFKYGENVPTIEQTEWLELFHSPSKKKVSAVIWSLDSFIKLLELWTALNYSSEYCEDKYSRNNFVLINGMYFIHTEDQLPARYKNLLQPKSKETKNEKT